jgi:hypothetical protein
MKTRSSSGASTPDRQCLSDGEIPSDACVRDDRSRVGLSGDEARRRLAKFGPNAMPDTAPAVWRKATAKFWAPVQSEMRISQIGYQRTRVPSEFTVER